jgi:hypothetical protein
LARGSLGIVVSEDAGEQSSGVAGKPQLNSQTEQSQPTKCGMIQAQIEITSRKPKGQEGGSDNTPNGQGSHEAELSTGLNSARFQTVTVPEWHARNG